MADFEQSFLGETLLRGAHGIQAADPVLLLQFADTTTVLAAMDSQKRHRLTIDLDDPPEAWLLAEWPTDADERTDLWLSTLPADTPLEELVRLAKISLAYRARLPRIENGSRLDHFEGRSWLGWHHHATLVTAAHLFLTTLRLTDPKRLGRTEPLRKPP